MVLSERACGEALFADCAFWRTVVSRYACFVEGMWRLREGTLPFIEWLEKGIVVIVFISFGDVPEVDVNLG